MSYRLTLVSLLSAFALLYQLTIASAAAESKVSIAAPSNGWRNGNDKDAAFTQQVSYPASSVNTPANQSELARIRGSITATPKSEQNPATLVVNGVAMPLRIEEDGSFDRPYSFSPGSNSVEVRAADGIERSRVQFLHDNKDQVAAGLRIVLSWDSNNTDLDLHVITPDGSHCWYGDRVLNNGAALDVDVTTGYGPEIFAMPAPLKGRYQVYVNYYGAGEAEQELTTMRVTLITQEGTVNEKQQSFIVPLREPGELTLVKSFSYP